jgi:hypothetical protein
VRRLLAVAVALVAVAVGAGMAPAASTGAPWRTEAWATARLKTVHYWHGYRLDDHSFDYVGGNGWNTPTNRDGEELYRSFNCGINSAGSSFRHFHVTLHTRGAGFYLTAGWS